MAYIARKKNAFWYLGLLFGVLALVTVSLVFVISAQAQEEPPADPPPAQDPPPADPPPEELPPANDPPPAEEPPAEDPPPADPPAEEPPANDPPAEQEPEVLAAQDEQDPEALEGEEDPQEIVEEQPLEEEGEEEVPENQGDAEVETGDAVSTAGSQNDVNSTDTTVPTNASTTVANTNEAELGNEAEADANTGENAASGGSATVVTGDAVAAANVINVVNTNIVNSNGILAFLNFLFGWGFDLRSFDLSYFLGGAAPSGGCSFSNCDDGSLNVSNTNEANVTNTVLVRANSGGNSATSTGEGGAYIETGDAYASANVYNLVNTNFINSNYFLISLNNFGDLFGDITLPGASFFEALLAQGGSGVPGGSTISNNNTATVNSTTTAQANSGDNTAGSQGGDASVTTGDAVSGATTYNQVNTNLVGGTRVFMLINIIGDWSGNVFGLPAGMSWTTTPTGIALMSDGASGGAGSPLDALNVNNTNNATVNNDVQVYALTGDNHAKSATSSDATVSTGNAYASSNVVNIVNTNVIGQNWVFAIFNIFGSWLGDLNFGKPDLWIGGVAQTQSPAMPGAPVTYKFTVSNTGDAPATNVKLSAKFLKGLLKFESGEETESGLFWNLGDIPFGETKEFTFTARAGEVPAGSELPVPLEATVTSDQKDQNTTDNTELLTIMVGQLAPIIGNMGAGKYTPDPEITMTKEVSVSTTTMPSKVDYTVTIYNKGGAAYRAKLTDTLKGPKGKTVYTRSWNLGTIEADDEITLTYTIEYGAEIASGLYTNTARLTGQRNNSVAVHAVDMNVVEASAIVEVLPGVGKVLSAQTEESAVLPEKCAAFITDYIRPGTKNDETQVKRLQHFLRDFDGSPLEITGVYDEPTIAAVKRFQNKHQDEILVPWGLSQPSGTVFYTTKAKINEIYCQGISEFPLSSLQSRQILAYKNRVKAPTVAEAPKPKIWSAMQIQPLTQFNFLPPLAAPKVEAPTAATTPAFSRMRFGYPLVSLLRDLWSGASLGFMVEHAQASGR